MNNLTMYNLETCFHDAKTEGYRFVGLRVKMEGFPKDEIIINEEENFTAKLEYYKKTYDNSLNHKFAKGVSIVGVCYGDNFDDIEFELVD